MNILKHILTGGVAALCAAGLAACGGGNAPTAVLSTGTTAAPSPTPAPSPAPPPASTSAQAGKSLYASYCAACHGSNAAANAGRILLGANNPGLITSVINSNYGNMGYLSATIDGAAAADLAAFLATPGI